MEVKEFDDFYPVKSRVTGEDWTCNHTAASPPPLPIGHQYMMMILLADSLWNQSYFVQVIANITLWNVPKGLLQSQGTTL